MYGCIIACLCICVCDPMQACARVRACLRARRERRRNPRSRPLAMCHYVQIYVGMCEPICICKRAYMEYMPARMCVCVCACERASGAARTRATTRLARAGMCYAHLYNVRLYRRSCIEACTDAQMRTRTRASAAPCGFGCSHTLAHARMDGCICVRVSMARHRRACIGMHVYVYI